MAYAEILNALYKQGTPADAATLAWLDANYAGQPWAVLKNTTASAGAKLRGTGNVLAWWGDGTSTTTALSGSDSDVGKSYGSSATRGIVLLGTMTEWRASSAYGNAYAMRRMPVSLTYLNLASTGVSGDLSAVSALTSLTYLNLASTGVSGDLSAVSALTSLTGLNLASTGVSGDLSAVSALTSLTNLYLASTGVSGDLSAVSALTSLTNLYLGGTGVSGDLSAVSALTSLTNLFLGGTGVSGATSPTINSIPDLGTCDIGPASLPQAAVDTVLSDAVDSLSLPGRVTCTLDLSGNAAPSASGTSDKSTLVSAGWTVTTA